MLELFKLGGQEISKGSICSFRAEDHPKLQRMWNKFMKVLMGYDRKIQKLKQKDCY